MKSRNKKGKKAPNARLPKYRNRILADEEIAAEVRDVSQSPRQLPSLSAPVSGRLLVQGVDLSNRSVPDAADDLEPTAPRRRTKLKGGAKLRDVTVADDLADIPPPSIARKLRSSDVAKRRVRRTPPAVDTTVGNSTRFDEFSYSDHMFHDVLSVALHALAARKILDDPSLVEGAREILEKWISRHQRAPRPFVEWRHILAGTPQKIAAVAMSLTEEAAQLRSSSPLGCLVTPKERAAVYALFGKSSPQARGTEIFTIASAMKVQGLAKQFIFRAVDLAQEFDRILNLMRMWRDEVELADRQHIVDAIQGAIDDCAQIGVAKPLIHPEVRAKALDAFLEEWELQHGAFTAEELGKADKELSVKKP